MTAHQTIVAVAFLFSSVRVIDWRSGWLDLRAPSFSPFHNVKAPLLFPLFWIRCGLNPSCFFEERTFFPASAR